MVQFDPRLLGPEPSMKKSAVFPGLSGQVRGQSVAAWRLTRQAWTGWLRASLCLG